MNTRQALFPFCLVSLIVAPLCGSPAFGDTDPIQSLEARVAKLEQQSARGVPLRASWQNGIRLQSDDNVIRLQLGGRVQNDFAFFSGDHELEAAVGPLRDGTKFRRARIYVSGTLYEHGIFKAEYDFAGGNPIFRDVWVGMQNIPGLGTVRIGNQLEPFSLEALSGNSFHLFMERGLPAAFYPFRNTGVVALNSVLEQRATWSAGLFRHSDNFGDSSTNSKYSATARVTALPYYADAGKWIHVGASASRRKPDNETARFSSRPESYVAPVFADTGSIPSDRIDLLGAEFSLTFGPASLQAEYYNAGADLVEEEEFGYTGSADFSGYYVYAGYFLTGEHRTYNRGNGTIGRTIPKSNFRGEGHGWGAWEVGIRHSELDLSDGPIEGGEMRNLSLGVNWYLNPNMRVMWNYVYADFKDVGTADIAQMRVQFDF